MEIIELTSRQTKRLGISYEVYSRNLIDISKKICERDKIIVGIIKRPTGCNRVSDIIKNIPEDDDMDLKPRTFCFLVFPRGADYFKFVLKNDGIFG